MKKFGMLLFGLSLVGYTVGCGGPEGGTEPEPAPPAANGGGEEAGSGEMEGGGGAVEEEPAE